MATVLEQPQIGTVLPTSRIKAWLEYVVGQAREDEEKTADPGARALLETTVEVLTGLKSAFDYYEAVIEPTASEESSPATEAPADRVSTAKPDREDASGAHRENAKSCDSITH
jgi:hypothetical protein